MTSGWRSLLAWSAAALLVAVIAVTLGLGGTNGPAYIVHLTAAYCL